MQYTQLISMLILITSFTLVANKKTKSCIKTFRVQSIFVVIACAFLGFNNLMNNEGFDILIVCLLVFLLKVIYIPMILNKTYSKIKYRVETYYFMNTPLLILISCLIVASSYFLIASMSGLEQNGLNLLLVNSISTMMIGFLFMISRKKAIDQIIGYLVIENGLFITAIFSTNGMPLIVDIGIFIDLISTILITGVIVFKISQKFDSTDIDKLRDLRG